MRHADDDLLHAVLGGAFSSSSSIMAMVVSPPSIEKRLWPLKRLSRNPSNPSAQTRRLRACGAASPHPSGTVRGGFHALLDPFPLVRIVDVHVLRADLARISSSQTFEQRRAAAARRTIPHEMCDPDPKWSARAPKAPDPDATAAASPADRCPPPDVRVRARPDEPRHARLLQRIGADHRRRGLIRLPAPGLRRNRQIAEDLVVEIRPRLRAAPAYAPGTCPTPRLGSRDDRRCRSWSSLC